jgi:hypothetical protein
VSPVWTLAQPNAIQVAKRRLAGLYRVVTSSRQGRESGNGPSVQICRGSRRGGSGGVGLAVLFCTSALEVRSGVTAPPVINRYKCMLWSDELGQ